MDAWAAKHHQGQKVHQHRVVIHLFGGSIYWGVGVDGSLAFDFVIVVVLGFGLERGLEKTLEPCLRL
jgi:hypothetical protein